MKRNLQVFLVLAFSIGLYGLARAAETDLVWSTFLGSTLKEYGTAICVESPSDIYVTGYTFSTGFPTTPGAYDRTYGTSIDAFVTKLNASGSALIYSTFLGGGGGERGHGIVVDDAGNAYVVGEVSSNDFPVTYGSYDTTHNSSEDAFITKLNASGNGLIYSTYLGGGSTDEGYAIALDGAGRACVTGFTYSGDFPATPGAFDETTNGWYDVFVARFNSAGSTLVYSTFLGGSLYDYGYALALDDSGRAHITGSTYSSNFPTTPGAWDRSHNLSEDAFVVVLDPAGPFWNTRPISEGISTIMAATSRWTQPATSSLPAIVTPPISPPPREALMRPITGTMMLSPLGSAPQIVLSFIRPIWAAPIARSARVLTWTTLD